jgi:purine-cytosine permease-like protein
MLFLKFNGRYRYERISWFPVLTTFVIASVIGGKHLFNPPPATPATASAVLSFASTLAVFSITYSALSSDYTNYYRPNVSR